MNGDRVRRKGLETTLIAFNNPVQLSSLVFLGHSEVFLTYNNYQ